MKGIILAGGSGTRLRPASLGVSKQLMPVYDKPLVYYPLTSLILCGIREILIISTPEELSRYKQLFSFSSQWGIELRYAEQSTPGGIAEALIIGEDFIDNEPVTLILGDNFFHGIGLGRQFIEEFSNTGALITAYHVADAGAFGVVEFDESGTALSIEEKPIDPKTSWAVPGMYVYDSTATDRTKRLTRSARGELEITDLNNSYLLDNCLKVKVLSRGTTWLDMGTPDALLSAAEYVQAIQERQGLLVGSPEEACWQSGWISDQELLNLTKNLKDTTYGRMLENLITKQIQ